MKGKGKIPLGSWIPTRPPWPPSHRMHEAEIGQTTMIPEHRAITTPRLHHPMQPHAGYPRADGRTQHSELHRTHPKEPIRLTDRPKPQAKAPSHSPAASTRPTNPYDRSNQSERITRRPPAESFSRPSTGQSADSAGVHRPTDPTDATRPIRTNVPVHTLATHDVESTPIP